MDLSTIFDDNDLMVLRAMQHLYEEEVTIRTHTGHVLQLTWEGDDALPVWRVEVELPSKTSTSA
jgi:hypothetical protein